MQNLSGKNILIMATDGFEESELTGPRDILSKAGASVKIAAPDKEPIQATKHDEKTIKVQPDLTVEEADCADFDVLVLPGGVVNPDALRRNDKAVKLVCDFNAAGKPIAAICHGPWMLVEANIIEGRKVTGWPSIRTDLRNAGGEVVDEEAVTDGNIITSRKPDDVPAFCDAIAEAVCADELVAG